MFRTDTNCKKGAERPRMVVKKTTKESLVYLRLALLIFFIAALSVVSILFIWLPSTTNEWHKTTAAFGFGIAGSLSATLVYIWVYAKREGKVEAFLDLGLIDAWESRRGGAVADNQVIHWLKIVRAARNRCIIMGVSLSGYCEGEDWESFCGFVRDQIGKIDFSVLFLDPRSDAAKLRSMEEKAVGKLNTYDRIFTGISKFWAFKKQLEQNGDRFKMYVYQTTPTFSVTLADNYMVVTHYLPNQANKDCPAFGIINFRFFKRFNALYNVYLHNLEKMIKSENEITQSNYAKIREAADEGRRRLNDM